MSNTLVDWYLGLDKTIEEGKLKAKVMSKSEFYCCNFCGIADHLFEHCTEDERVTRELTISADYDQVSCLLALLQL